MKLSERVGKKKWDKAWTNAMHKHKIVCWKAEFPEVDWDVLARKWGVYGPTKRV